MGLLTEAAGASPAKAAFAASGVDMENAALTMRESAIEAGARLLDESEFCNKYDGLKDLMSEEDSKSQYKAAMTAIMVERTAQFIENMKKIHGEAVVNTSLGELPNRVLDVVRIFYPNQIATELLDIQPIDGEVGQIFTMKPRFTNALDNISAGDEVFVNTPTHNNYASEEYVESLGTGDNSTVTFGTTLGNLPVRKETVTVTATVGGSTVTGTDDGNGNITGTGIASGTINYDTGAISVTFDTAPDGSTDVSVTYCWSTEVAEDAIRQLEFDLGLTPVQAKIHPLTFKYSVRAGLAAQAHLAIDVQDTLAELAGQYIKIERDRKVVDKIIAGAIAEASLNFNADATGIGYDKRALYGEMEIKLDEAEALIQDKNGRGSVDFVLVGRNAANVIRHARGFRPAAVNAPIGAHVIGTLRDGTVTVVKDLKMDPNTYVFGYKGYMAGDAAMILAEWIPIYFTPVFQAPTLTNRQGTMSMYDLFVNNSNYYVKGTLSNYSA